MCTHTVKSVYLYAHIIIISYICIYQTYLLDDNIVITCDNMVHKGGAKLHEGIAFRASGTTGGRAVLGTGRTRAAYSTLACVCPYPFVHLRIGRRFMGISSALWTTGGRAVCAPVHETRPQARPPPRSDGGRGIAAG